MSRIRRIGYAISDKGRRSSVNNQAFRIRESVLSLLDEINQNAQVSRRVTKKAAFTVVLRSLQSTRNLPFSLREHMALKELSQYINLAQNNKSNALTLSNTDLLPVSHPRSTRQNSMTASALREAKIRWVIDDPRITDDRARTVLASALLAEIDSVEHTYYTSMLSALPQGTIPAETLLAAIGDGNSPFNRSLRAQLQRRDRKGRFAFMGGGLRALVRRGSRVFSFIGRTLMDTPDGKVLIELPDGRIAKINPERGEYIKAVINPTKDGYSAKPVRTSVTDDVIDEADLEFVESPEGWRKEGGYTWKNGDWVVTKDDFGNFRASDKKGNGAEGNSWADILDQIDEIEQPTQEQVAKLPEAEKVSKKKSFEFEYPEGAFKLKVGQKYDPQGAGEDEDVPRDFTDDPAELAQKFDPRDLKQALEEAVIPQGENENAFGVGPLEFNDGNGLVEAGALHNALDEAGEDADLELARIYDKANGNNNNEQALLDSRKGEETVDQSKPDVAESFERVTKESTPDVEPAAEEPAFVEEKRDTTPLPALLEGLEENELARFIESKDHTPYLPKNEDIDMPEGYNKLNPAPFQTWREVDANNPDPVLPEGFSDNPVFIAQNVSKEDLLKELRRATEPGNEAPGYGAIKLKTEDDEDFVANVPGEAVRDALQLQGVDTNAELKKISDEGMAGQQEQQAELPLDLPKEKKPMNAYERLMAEQQAEKDAVDARVAELKKNAEDRVDGQGRAVPTGWGISQKFSRGFGRPNANEYSNVYGLNNFEASVDDNGKIEIKDRNKLIETKTYENWDEVQADLDARKAEYAKASREKIKEFAKGYGFSDEQIAAFDSMTQAEIADFFANPDNHTEAYKSALDDFETSWAVDMPRPAQRERWAAFGKEKRISEQAGDFPEEGQKAELPPLRTTVELPGEEPELPPLRTTVEQVETRKTNVRPEIPQDFEVNALEEVPDGLEEYPAAANVAPAAADDGGGSRPPGGGDGKRPPIRITVKVKDILPGDITVGDHFVVTEIGEKVPGTDRVKIKGYYPGHVEQDTKQWNEWREIQVIRGAEAPEKGELPVLSKPKEKEFGRRKKSKDGIWGFANPDDQARFDAAMAEYNVQLDAAKKRWVDPTEPANQPHRVISRAADVQPGDVTTDPKKGHFVIERTFTDEKTKPGFVSVEGYYPGHVTQRKEWKVDTPIDVIRNAEIPPKGDLEELHQPHNVVDGKWRPDKDPAKRAEHQKKLDEAAARWQAPTDLPIIDNKDNAAEPDKDIPNAVAIKRPSAPRQIEMPAFQGEMANIAREANGDWNKFRELLKDRDLIFFDYETTGVNAEDGNEPWQVAAVRVRNGEIIDRVNIFMNPGRSIADTYAGRDTDGVPNAVDADGNKLSDEFLAKQPNQEEAMRQLMEWAGPDAIFGAQNMVFDEEVARRLADRYGIDWAPAGLLDVLPMARDIYKDQPKENRPKTPKGRESYALGNLAKHLGIDLENWHAADADAEAAAKIFNALIDKGIEFDAGKDLFDVDARNDEYLAKMDQYNKDFDAYEEQLAQFAAAKALQDGLRGADVNADDALKTATPAKAEGAEVDAGPVGAEPAPRRARDEVVVLDFTPNVDFPRGKMILKDRDWVLNDDNTVLLPRENVRMRDLLPGDFAASKDGNVLWQVVAVRAGEEFGLRPGRVKVYRRNLENGEVSTYENWHGMFLDGIRRPINPRDLDAPETIQPGEKAPFIANEPADLEKIEKEAKANENVYFDVQPIYEGLPLGVGGARYMSIRKTEDGKFALRAVIYDNEGNEIYIAEDEYRTLEGARAEGEALLKEQIDAFVAQNRKEQPEPEEARAKDVPVSRGDIPGDANNIPQIVEVENLPPELAGDVKIKNIGLEKPDFEAQAVLRGAEGDVIAHQTSNHPNKDAAEKEGRDFINRAAEAAQNPEPIAEEKPKREKKPLTAEKIKAAEEKEAQEKDNAWVEDNAGKIPPIEAIEIKKGDFLWEPFWGNYAEVLEVKYIGYLDRVEFKVMNRVNGKIEDRFLKADSPIRNVRRLGVSDQEFEINDDTKGTNRGAKRGVIKRKKLEERVVAKEGRPMGGRFEKEGFFRDKNGNPLVPGDVVIHPKYGRGVVKKREGAQVEEGKKAGGVVRGKKVYLDHVMVQFEGEEAKWVLNQGGRIIKAKNLVRQDEIAEPVRLPNFRGGRKAANLVPGDVPRPRPAVEEPKAEDKPAEDKAAEELKNFVAPNFDALDNQQIVEGLNYINDQLEIAKAWYKAKGRDKATTVGNAQKAIKNLLNNFDVAKPDKIDLDELDAAIRRVNRTSDLEEVRQSLADLRDKLAAEKKRLEVEREKAIVENIANPLAPLPDVDGLNVDNFGAALDEIIERLPSNGRSSNLRYLASAKDYLSGLRKSVTAKDDLIEDVNIDERLNAAINYLNRVEGLDATVIQKQIEDISKLVSDYRRKNRKPFGKINMPFVDPIELRDKRIADGENKFNLAQAPNLKQEFADDELFDNNEFLQPYKEEIKNFFAQGGEAPLAQMSNEARQAVAQHVRSMFAAKGPASVDEKKARAIELVNLMRGLHEEKLAFDPNRPDLGPAGEALKDIDFNAVFSAGQKLRNSKATDLVVNGQDTGFRIQLVGDGINQSYNFRLIHKDTGQVFYFKRERGLEEAEAEIASNQLARALGIVGTPVVVQHNNDAQVLIMTNAGDNMDWKEKPRVAGNDVGDRVGLARRAAIIDLIGLGILDAIIYNSDRHRNNILLAVNDRGGVGGNGFEEIQLLPIDHGFAQAFQKKNRATVGDDPGDWFVSGNERDGGKIVKELAKEIGAINFKELTDMTIQQAIQAIERGDYLGEVNPANRQKIIDRLLALKGIDADKWKLAIAKKL